MYSKFVPRLKMSKFLIIQIIDEFKEDNSTKDSLEIKIINKVEWINSALRDRVQPRVHNYVGQECHMFWITPSYPYQLNQ